SVINGEKGRLRFGARLRLKDKVRDNIFYSYEPIDDMGSLAAVQNVYWGGASFNPGAQYAPGYFADKALLGNLDLTNANLFDAALEPSEYLSSNYKAKERITAGYLRWDQDFNSKTSLIAGVRLEQTNIEYSGNYIMDEEDLVGEINNKNNYLNVLPSVTLKHKVNDNFILRAAVTTSLARPNYYNLAPYVNVKTSLIAGVRLEQTNIEYSGNYIMDEEDLVGEINNKNNYLNVLPSVTLKHKVNDNFILRAAVTTSLARPNYYNLAPYVNVIPEDSEIAELNPNLKATYSTYFDIMTENYFQNIGIVSAGVFYKNLDNF